MCEAFVDSPCWSELEGLQRGLEVGFERDLEAGLERALERGRHVFMSSLDLDSYIR